MSRVWMLAAALTLPSCSSALMNDPPALVPPASIGAPSLRPFVDGRTWVLERELVFHVDGWPAIRVPAGFVTDLASIPRVAQPLRSPVGTYNRAAILHDWLYWTGLCRRDEADLIFRRAMETSGSSPAVAAQVYRAVELGGWYAFDENARLRALEGAAAGTGERRLVTMHHNGSADPLAALDDIYWPAHDDPDRARILAPLHMIASPVSPERPGWCEIGRDPNATELPRAYRPRKAKR